MRFLLLLLILSQIAEAAPSRSVDHVVSNSLAVGKTSVANTKSVLELSSTTKGFLPPKMTQAQRDAISSPPIGLQTFNTDTNRLNSYNGSVWEEVGSGSGGGGQYVNLLSNPGFETGTSNWTASGGTFTATSTAANVGQGSQAGSWDASASSQTLSSDTYTVKAGLFGRNCLGKILYKGGDSTLTLEVYDGTNVIASQALSAAAGFNEASVSFICPTSGNLILRMKASGDAAIVFLDEMYLGENYKLGTVTQAQFAGAAYIANTASCTWTRNNAAIGDFGTVSACPGPTIEKANIGSWQTTDTDLPQFTINNLPPGDYQVIMTFTLSASSSAVRAAITDGTTISIATGLNPGGVNSPPVTHVAYFSYSSAGNRSFKLQVGGTSVSLDNESYTGGGVRIAIYRHPSSTEQAYRFDQTPASWAGYHDNTCSWSRTNAAFGDFTADASCALIERTNRNFGTVSASGSVLPSITFAPPRSGRYLVIATPAAQVATAGTNGSLRLWDGTTVIAYQDYSNGASFVSAAPLIGIYNAASTASVTLTIQGKAASGAMTINGVDSSVNWSIFELDAAMPTPALFGNLISNTSGQERVERAKLSCYASSGGIPVQSGNWLTSITPRTTAKCSVTIGGGFFSATPVCVGTRLYGTTAAEYVAVNPTSTTNIDVYNSSANDFDIFLICMGSK